jgi:hypothetical protein
MELGSGYNSTINASSIAFENRYLSKSVVCDRQMIVPSSTLVSSSICGSFNTADIYVGNSELCVELELHTIVIKTSLDQLDWVLDANDEEEEGIRREIFLAISKNKTVLIDYM